MNKKIGKWLSNLSENEWLTVQLVILFVGIVLAFIIGFGLSMLTKMLDLYFICPGIWLMLFILLKYRLEEKYIG